MAGPYMYWRAGKLKAHVELEKAEPISNCCKASLPSQPYRGSGRLLVIMDAKMSLKLGGGEADVGLGGFDHVVGRGIKKASREQSCPTYVLLVGGNDTSA